MTYNEGKEKARGMAQEIQCDFYDLSISWNEVCDICAKLEKLAKRYGLVREFKENGLI